jgi:hypothetical protein
MTLDHPALVEDLRAVLNRHHVDTDAETPDFLLAEFLQELLLAFASAMCDRDMWHREQRGGMPVFVIKGQDALAIQAIAEYRNLCVQFGLSEQAVQVQLAIDEVEAWQAANPGRVKLPDHEHVPVGQ